MRYQVALLDRVMNKYSRRSSNHLYVLEYRCLSLPRFKILSLESIGFPFSLILEDFPPLTQPLPWNSLLPYPPLMYIFSLFLYILSLYTRLMTAPFILISFPVVWILEVRIVHASQPRCTRQCHVLVRHLVSSNKFYPNFVGGQSEISCNSSRRGLLAFISWKLEPCLAPSRGPHFPPVMSVLSRLCEQPLEFPVLHWCSGWLR